MGNCLNKPVSWVDDDEWETAEEISDYKKTTSSTKGAADHDGGTATTEVKIKISKKQLEKMLQQAAAGSGGKGKSLKLEKVLMDLVNHGHVVYRPQEQEDASRHWRPKLQSIPEIAD